MIKSRPHTTVILAASADGKIADRDRSAARFGSQNDQFHLQQQIAQADAVLFGAATLRAYGSTMPVSQMELQQQRQARGQPPQPIQIVCARSPDFDATLRFFRQSVPRWLLTTASGHELVQQRELPFDRVLLAPEDADGSLVWAEVLPQLHHAGVDRLAVLGGGSLVASLWAEGWIDELWLTVCPLILGGKTAPTPVDGSGFSAAIAPRLRLLDTHVVEDEVFLHYEVRRETPA